MPFTPASYMDKARVHWPALEQAVFAELGATATIFEFGAPRRSGANKLTSTTFTTRRAGTGIEVTVTCRSTAGGTATAIYSWATPLDLAKASNWQGVIPALTFNGTGNNMDAADNAYWTTAAASTFSVGAWIRPSLIASNNLIGKWREVTASPLREWRLWINASGKLEFDIYDESEDTFVARTFNTAITTQRIYHVVATYGGGTTDATCKIYLDGAQVDDTNGGSGVFVSMEDATESVKIGSILGADGNAGNFFGGIMYGGPLGPCFTQVELSAAKVKNLYLLGADALGL